MMIDLRRRHAKRQSLATSSTVKYCFTMDSSFLPALHVFTLVAKSGSYSRVARQLGVSTSAVSQTIRKLEDHLELSLLRRTSRSVATTADGARLLERSADGLDRALAGLTAARARSDEIRGTVRLSVPEQVADIALVPLIPTFLREHPNVSLEVDVDNAPVDLIAAGFDAGIRMESVPRDMVQVRLHAPFRIVVVAAPSYVTAAGEPQSLADLARHRLVGMRTRPTWTFQRGARTIRQRVSPTFISNDTRLRIEMVEAGVGLGYVSELDVRPQLTRGTLRVVLADHAVKVPGLFLYYPGRQSASPPLRALIDHLRHHRRAVT